MIGQTLNHYQVLREIGQDALRQVFLARDLRLDRPVALKLPPALVTGEKRRKRFDREAVARQTKGEISTSDKSPWVPSTALAHLPFALGEVDRGFAWLQKAVDEKDQTLLIFNVSPYYAPYRADPRYQHILRQLGLDRG